MVERLRLAAEGGLACYYALPHDWVLAEPAHFPALGDRGRVKNANRNRQQSICNTGIVPASPSIASGIRRLIPFPAQDMASPLFIHIRACGVLENLPGFGDVLPANCFGGGALSIARFTEESESFSGETPGNLADQ